ncbi:MAG: NAD(P)-binding domain-containing protein [Bacteroidales bacterium]|nr:NAD(P)-binding domain-containing protein [Bacteroidales bacterium]
MEQALQNICIIGSGAIGTALGNVLAKKKMHNVTLLSIEEDVVQSINETRHNFKYFGKLKLSKHLKATMDVTHLRKSDIVFLAIPSVVTVEYMSRLAGHLGKDTIILNMAKGFSSDKKTIIESLESIFPNPVCSFKGPTFARELILKQPTAFTLGSREPAHAALFGQIFDETTVYIDFTNDVKGVEILSILKNIYAIAAGIVDAHYNSPNLRFLFLTRAFNEMRQILLKSGGREDTMFRYCGFGDFSLTALNDLSRNRTLGLLIGKGFFTENISDKVVLEGKNAVNIFCEEIAVKNNLDCKFPIISELFKVFNEKYDVSKFVNRLLKGA